MKDNLAKEVIKNKYILTFPYLNQERTKKFISIALTLLALSFFGFFAINPTISTILKLRKELSDSQAVYDQLETKIKNLSLLRAQYSSLQNSLPIIFSAIPTQPDVSILFAQIQTLARQSNIKIKKLQSSEVEIYKNNMELEKQYYSHSFLIGGNGSLKDINNFVSGITNMERVINIETFSINNAPSKDDPSLGFNIQGTAFFKQ